MYTTPSRPLLSLIVATLQHLNLLYLMAGGRTKYSLTNARCNETLPGFKALTPKDHAHAVQDPRTT